MFALTYPRETAEGPVLTDPLTGRRYTLEEVDLPDDLRDFLAGMLGESPAHDGRLAPTDD